MVRSLHTDHEGTPRLATNATGAKIWRWEGRAFGDTNPQQDPDGNGVTTTVNLRFAGQYFDAETGLHYNNHRYYSPALGRYITSDPIGLAGGVNTYVYSNRPLNEIDPLGLMGYDPRTSPSPQPWPSWPPGFNPANGNLWPGYSPQDWICTVPGSLGGYMNSRPCVKKCCIDHDACYKQYGCNASSWMRPPTGACQLCNLKAQICVLMADKSPNGCGSCGAPRDEKENN